MDDIGQIVLRFRDIERPIGETVSLHRESINESGFTWWGWLYRSYETIPVERFRQVQKVIEKTGQVEVLLYDTGQGRMYSTNCVEVAFQNYLEASPDPKATPAYYNGRSAPAWFKLTCILEAPDDCVIGRICFEMPSEIEDCSVDLHGSVVHKLSDLRRQEVTLWLIR